MRVADYVAKALADFGARDVFLLSGGGAMFLNNAIGSEPRLRYWCNHHEQAGAIAAEGYARVSGCPGVINVTSGPGGINALYADGSAVWIARTAVRCATGVRPFFRRAPSGPGYQA